MTDELLSSAGSQAAPTSATVAGRIDRLRAQLWPRCVLTSVHSRALAAIAAGEPALLALPADAARAMCYQLPGLAAEATTVVVEPSARGLPGCTRRPTHRFRRRGGFRTVVCRTGEAVLQRACRGALGDPPAFLYLSPDLLRHPEVEALLRVIPLARLVIEDGPCYTPGELRRLSSILTGTRWRQPPVITAATWRPQVHAGILHHLGLKNVRTCAATPVWAMAQYMIIRGQDKVRRVIDIVYRFAQPGMVLVPHEAAAGRLVRALEREGVRAFLLAPPEAGRTLKQRMAQAAPRVVVGTHLPQPAAQYAWRYLIHTGLPASLEAYLDETLWWPPGRRRPCILLYDQGDRRRALTRRLRRQAAGEDLFTGRDPSEGVPLEDNALVVARREQARRALIEVEEYVRTDCCRVQFLQERTGMGPATGPCGECDVCMGRQKETLLRRYDPSVVRTVFRAVLEVREKFGLATLMGVLQGRPLATIRRFHLAEASTYGALRHVPPEAIRTLIDNLLRDGFLTVRRGLYPTIRLTHWGRRVVGDEPVTEVCLPRLTQETPGAPCNGALFEALRRVRARLARRYQVTTFEIAHDRVLQAIATTPPRSLAELGAIRGIGPVKLRQFGSALLSAVRACLRRPRASIVR